MHRIIELMEERGLKQSEIMKVCNVGQSTISMWKKGATPNVQTLMILADYFQVSIDYLLGREDDYGNVTVGTTGEKLTLREEELLSCFRQMPDNIKNAVLETAKIMLDSVKEK